MKYLRRSAPCPIPRDASCRGLRIDPVDSFTTLTCGPCNHSGSLPCQQIRITSVHRMSAHRYGLGQFACRSSSSSGSSPGKPACRRTSATPELGRSFTPRRQRALELSCFSTAPGKASLSHHMSNATPNKKKAAEMFEKFEVVETHNRYCDALDRGDSEALLAVFTEDAVWACEPLMGTYRGHEGIRTVGKLIADVVVGTNLHTTSNHIVDIDGDTARLRCYLTVVVWGEALGGSLHIGTAGRYDADLVRQDGVWKFRKLDILLSAAQEADDRLKA
jgi:ketosteroid isomerase-like protein